MKQNAVMYLVIGFLLGLCLMLFIGAGSDIGRYEFHTVKHYTYGKLNSESVIIFDSNSGSAKRFLPEQAVMNFNR